MPPAALVASAPARDAAARAVVSGTVVRLMDSAETAFVRLESGDMVTMPQAFLPEGVRVGQVLAEGMRISGQLDGANLRVEIPSVEVGTLTARFPAGCVTLALVVSDKSDGAQLALHPHVPVLVSRRDVSSNPRDELDNLLAVGEVVRVRVLHHTDGTLRFQLLDIDDEEPVVPPVALLPGGPAWLRAPSEEDLPSPHQEPAPEPGLPAVTVVDDAPDAKRALQTAQLTITAKQAQISLLERELQSAQDQADAQAAAAREELQRVRKQVQDERVTAAELRREVRELKRAMSTIRPERPRDRRSRSWTRRSGFGTSSGSPGSHGTSRRTAAPGGCPTTTSSARGCSSRSSSSTRTAWTRRSRRWSTCSQGGRGTFPAANCIRCARPSSATPRTSSARTVPAACAAPSSRACHRRDGCTTGCGVTVSLS